MTKIFLSLVLAVVSAAANTEDFVVPASGSENFVLSLPEGWSARLNQSMPGLPPTAEIMSSDRTAFQVLVTPIPTIDGRTLSMSELRQVVERSLEAAKPSAEETTLPIQGFFATNSSGYYFSSTDRQPKPDEYKYLTQVAVALGDLAVTFTVLSNRDQVEVARKAMAMLKTARVSPIKK